MHILFVVISTYYYMNLETIRMLVAVARVLLLPSITSYRGVFINKQVLLLCGCTAGEKSNRLRALLAVYRL